MLVCDEYSSSDEPAGITAVTSTDYKQCISCTNGIRLQEFYSHWFLLFVREWLIFNFKWNILYYNLAHLNSFRFKKRHKNAYFFLVAYAFFRFNTDNELFQCDMSVGSSSFIFTSLYALQKNRPITFFKSSRGQRPLERGVR